MAPLTIRVALSAVAGLALAAAAVGVEALTNPKSLYNELGSFSTPKSAFLQVVKNDLLISTFGFAGPDTLYSANNIRSQFNNFSAIQPTVISNSIVYPNEVTPAPRRAVKGYPDLLVVAGGFIFKPNGAITLIDRATNNAFAISNTTDNRFYHYAQWYDVDKDGLLDLVTAGAVKNPGPAPGYGSLYWLKQPASNPLGQQWEQKKVIDGPDVYFQIVDLDNDGDDELLVSSFFGSKISIYTDLNWKNPSLGFKEVVVEKTIGPVFRAEAVDLNGDGIKEIVATNHVSDTTAGLFAYELPKSNFWSINLQGTYKKHTIASGFVTKNAGPGQASPGGAVVFKPTPFSRRPFILLAGDGNQGAYLYTPKDFFGFEYDQTTVLDSGATVGYIAAGDVTGDGIAEFFIPVYEKGLVYGYSFNFDGILENLLF